MSCIKVRHHVNLNGEAHMNGMAVLCSHVWVFPSSLCCCIYGIPVTVMYAEVIMVIALAMTVPHQDGDGKVSYMHDMY